MVHNVLLDEEYVPATHVWHVELLCAAAWAEYVPAGHDVQLLLPSAILYVPAGQTVQLVLLSALVYDPRGHRAHSGGLPNRLHSNKTM